MRIKFTLLFLFTFIFFSCEREYGEYYDPPKGQQGEIYKQMASDPSLSTFVAAVDKVPGLKQELSSSGLFTVVAPDNDAFRKFFEQGPYKSVDEIPAEKLSQIVKFHIIRWMLFQVNFMNPGVNKDGYDIFKYETRSNSAYREQAEGLARGRSIFYTNKMMQVYTPRYFSYYKVSTQDYADVFGNSALANEAQINFMGAAVKQKDIASGNGALYIIDKVLLPPLNVAQELDTNPEYSDYNRLLKRRFLTYKYNQAATIAQGNNGDVDGDGLLDSLWVRSYQTDANLDAENPLTPDKKGALSLTAFIPSKAAFQQYLQTRLLPNFSNHQDSIPEHTLLLLYKSHLTNTMDWPSKVETGFLASVAGDKINISRSDIKSVKMASNGLFYELNKVVEPSAFTAVTGPAFFAKQYWYFAEMLLQANVLGALTNEAVKYTLLAPTNEAFKARGIYWAPERTPGFFKWTGTSYKALSTAEMADLVGNHVLVNQQTPADQLADGFYPTLNRSYLQVEGGRFHGAERDVFPAVVDAGSRMSNGYFQGIDQLIHNPEKSLYEVINASNSSTSPTAQYLKFRELVSASGLLKKDFGTITAIDADRKFTLFAPTNEAIIAAQLAGKLPKTGAQGSQTLSAADKARLANWVAYFFVPGQVFTDGKELGTQPTRRLHPSSTPGNDVYQTLQLTYPGSVLTVTTNTGQLGRVDLSQPAQYPQNTIVRDGVIHLIDNAFTQQY